MSVPAAPRSPAISDDIEIVAHPCNERIDDLINVLFDDPRSLGEPWRALRSCLRRYGLFPRRELWKPQPHKLREKRYSGEPDPVDAGIGDTSHGAGPETHE